MEPLQLCDRVAEEISLAFKHVCERWKMLTVLVPGLFLSMYGQYALYHGLDGDMPHSPAFFAAVTGSVTKMVLALAGILFLPAMTLMVRVNKGSDPVVTAWERGSRVKDRHDGVRKWMKASSFLLVAWVILGGLPAACGVEANVVGILASVALMMLVSLRIVLSGRNEKASSDFYTAAAVGLYVQTIAIGASIFVLDSNLGGDVRQWPERFLVFLVCFAAVSLAQAFVARAARPLLSGPGVLTKIGYICFALLALIAAVSPLANKAMERAVERTSAGSSSHTR
ncbi:hypothetical protein ACVWWJ_004050 [Luteibacter sp. HA06]